MNKISLLLLLVSMGTSVNAQQNVRISLFYAEPQLGSNTSGNEPDSIKIYVKEPFRQVQMYAAPDLGYETGFDFVIHEYCPVQVCKNNRCFDLFIDSVQIQVLIDPDQFINSKPLYSPLSTRWQTSRMEIQQLRDAQMDSLIILMDRQPEMSAIVSFHEHYNKKFSLLCRKQIEENSSNLVGWNLLLSNPESFDKAGVNSLITHFGSLFSTRSIMEIKNRLTEYNRLSDPEKNIHEIFSFPN